MSDIYFSFNKDMREIFDYPDPSVPVVVWEGAFSDLFNRCLAYHWHNEFEYCVVRTGTVGFTVDGNYTQVQQGNAMFINANAMHSATQIGQTPVEVFTVSFLPSVLSGSEYGTVYRKYFLPVLRSSIKGFLIDRTKHHAAEILNGLADICDVCRAQSRDYELELIALISRTWSRTVAYLEEHKEAISHANTKHHDEEAAKSILNFIHNHYGEDIDIDDMAKCAKTSRSGCFRCFRNYTNKTPMAYLAEYRMARAMTLIARGGTTITQIAAECGFSNSSYFGKLFRKKHAMTPLEYRKQQQNQL